MSEQTKRGPGRPRVADPVRRLSVSLTAKHRDIVLAKGNSKSLTQAVKNLAGIVEKTSEVQT